MSRAISLGVPASGTGYRLLWRCGHGLPVLPSQPATVARPPAVSRRSSGGEVVPQAPAPASKGRTYPLGAWAQALAADKVV